MRSLVNGRELSELRAQKLERGRDALADIVVTGAGSCEVQKIIGQDDRDFSIWRCVASVVLHRGGTKGRG